MDLGIEGRVALVTGGDSGIGFAAARELLAEGARVVLTDRDGDALGDAVTRLRAAGSSDAVVGVPADLTVLADVEELARRAREAFGDPEILVHAAGVTGATGDFLEIDDDGWRSTLETDLVAAARTVRTFLPSMRERGRGRIVLLASEDAVQPYADELPYCASKAGVLALAKGLAKAYGGDGVLVNAVSPAFVATPMTDAMMRERADERGESFDEAVASFLAEERPGIEARRRGEPEEVAAVIAWLCSERASFVLGSNWRVDGGSVATI
ncbi:SDR family oxidoreductase [Luteimicrobium xylanilyticum]|uniref:3-oxoacyl-[acyl-carrier-protein] reductase n=1 Tax=Luteimicrobium xylanilyticum TaxID=1133546 RepID=A0A5P9QA46_9MICO|nr:SDR family oxidoreductase [Luteimicrobium xylanilyticum]QFU98126.1 3-oxoacyl-[acyl-carrier-protein] reductase [Luteimicrobium xylanilyticum]